MKILDVRRIAFHGQTGDNRSPEDFAFPAAMASMMEFLGEDAGIEVMRAHDTDWMHRSANDAFIAASGIGFALLWDRELCPSAQDLLQAAPYDRGIENAFAWAGWTYERVSGAGMKQAAVRAIEKGRPFIALGLTEVPEAALVCGCSENGDELYGWSHFQHGMKTIENGDELYGWSHFQHGMKTIENGMFSICGWEEHTWELIIPAERIGRQIGLARVISEGVRVMEQDSAEGFCAGRAAYEAWISALEQAGGDQNIFDYHHAILFNLAEARCWCGAFLRKQGVEAGRHFQAIHDLCWQADAAAKAAADLEDPRKKAALLSMLRRMQAEDRAALDELKAYPG